MSLDVSIRERNALLGAAELKPAFAERALTEESMRPYMAAIRSLIDNHEPQPLELYPAYVECDQVEGGAA